MSVSAVVLTKNSDSTLKDCLESVKWCDEIIVIDDNSIDKTLQIAKMYGAKIFDHSLSNDFALQRNFGLENASGDWVLFVDSDEVVNSSLREELIKINTDSNTDLHGYYVKRIDTMWGKRLEHGETGNIWLLRLAKKNKGKWQGKVHETWEIQGEKGRLQNSLDHFPHPTVSEFLKKINFYSTLRAEELYKQNINVNWWDIILYPKVKFWLNYIVKLGFRDGIPGFLVSVFMSFHSFLVRGKLWQLQHSQ